jgi:hypothetical protein
MGATRAIDDAAARRFAASSFADAICLRTLASESWICSVWPLLDEATQTAAHRLPITKRAYILLIEIFFFF